MPCDEVLADRLRKLMKRKKGYGERNMFGGVCFTINGNMCCGVTNTGDLMLRLGTEAEKALTEPHTRPMDFTGRPMKGMIFLEPAAYAGDADPYVKPRADEDDDLDDDEDDDEDDEAARI